jgi:pyrroloquinoline quinone biosynthesis protein D
MIERPTIGPEAKPRLPRGVRLIYNEAQGGWVLAAPERIFRANSTAVEILKRCDGSATLGTIVDDLAAQFSAPRDRVMADVTATLRQLADKRFLDI